MALQDIVAKCRASQNKVELLHLLDQVEKIKPKVIVEVGSWRGWLLETLREAFPEADILGIEADVTNIDPLNKEEIFVGDSNSPESWDYVVNKLNGRQIDFLFIDGNHLYEAVKKDFLLYHQLVRKGGIIAFHDVAIKDNPTVEVYQFWGEIKEMYKNNAIVGVAQNEQGIQSQGTGTGILYL